MSYIKKKAQTSTTSSYIDSDGRVFSVADMVQGFKPKGKYKAYSLAGKITSKDFGKVK